MESETLYHYNDLRLPSRGDEHHIRLLRLLPGSFEGDLHATLEVVSLSTKPTYDALSYTWGHQTEGKTIKVNDGGILQLTDNLNRALRYLRRRFRQRVLWIDALCINQCDVDERASQVRIMGHIYRNARCVRVWLGEPRSKRHMDLQSIYHACSLLFRSEFHVWYGRRKRRSIADILRDWAMLACNDPKYLDGAVFESSPPWHERAWVAQEFILAGQVYIHAGRRCWRENDIEFLDRFSYPNTPNLQSLTYSISDRMLSYRRRIVPSKLHHQSPVRRIDLDTCGIAETADLTGWPTEATDSRDLIYCVLGMINPTEANLIPVDYTLSAQQVCAYATYASLRSREGHIVLRNIKIPHESRPRDQISWAAYLSDKDRLALRMPQRVTNTFERRRDGVLMPQYVTTGLEHRTMPVSFGSPRHEGKLAGEMEMDPDTFRLAIRGVKCGKVITSCPCVYNLYDAHLSPWFDAHVIPELGEKLTATSGAIFRRLFNISGEQEQPTCGDLAREDTPVWGWHDIDDLFDYWAWIAHRMLGQAEDELPVWFTTTFLEAMEGLVSNVDGGKSLFVIEGGLLGFVPGPVAVGDEVVVIPYSDIRTSPFLLLRSREGEDCYEFRGLAWIYGCMHPDFWSGFHDLEDLGERIVID